MDLFASFGTLAELWCARQGLLSGPALARQRLEALVRHARAKSPLYRELYRGLGETPELASLPRVSRRTLMSRFDDWVTDPEVRRAGVSRFLADPARIGAPLLGRYHAWKSSGTSGEPGVFLQDAQSMAVYDALVGVQLGAVRWRPDAPARIAAARGRAALVVATGDHFASIAAWERIRRATPGIEARAFSALLPMAQLVKRLNAFQPAYLAGYPSLLALLALEQEAGRLAIAPALAWSGGEHLSPGAAAAIGRVFGCPVLNEYGASECLTIAAGCDAGWLHVNSEWVIVEGIDEHGRPAARGELSHTTLVTNLANRVQPIIRYDIGDRIVARAGACRCGDPRPAIRVEGRVEPPLCLRASGGREVRVPPLALAAVVEQAVGERRFQVAQTGPGALALRVQGRRGKALEAARARAKEALARYLRSQSLPDVELTLGAAPRIDARSGKAREVVVETGGL